MSREKESSRPALSLKDVAGRLREPLVKFLEGRYYPPLVALLVALGHITGLEFYLNIIVILLAGLSLILCESTLSLITPLITFLYQILY